MFANFQEKLPADRRAMVGAATEGAVDIQQGSHPGGGVIRQIWTIHRYIVQLEGKREDVWELETLAQSFAPEYHGTKMLWPCE